MKEFKGRLPKACKHPGVSMAPRVRCTIANVATSLAPSRNKVLLEHCRASIVHCSIIQLDMMSDCSCKLIRDLVLRPFCPSKTENQTMHVDRHA